MKKHGGNGGFTLIEVIVSVVLITLVSSGFLILLEANTRNLSRSWKVDSASYDIAGMIEEGRTDERELSGSWSLKYESEVLAGQVEEKVILYSIEKDGNRLNYFAAPGR